EKNTVSANANSASSGKAEVNAAYKKTYKKTYKRTYTRYKKTYRYSKYRYGKYRYAKAAYRTSYRTSYRGGAYTSGKGVGDCWANSEYLYNQLVSSGQNARILQYASSMSSRHRSVQVYQNGAWVNYDYRGNGYSWGYYATSGVSHGTVIKSSI
ncbi:MAG TPA: hypothetical protein VK444_03265, partial [Methanobacteriaceae archaeon]|nr:hypothetical protein [Methanobacteriaceae archaeon]